MTFHHLLEYTPKTAHWITQQRNDAHRRVNRQPCCVGSSSAGVLLNLELCSDVSLASLYSTRENQTIYNYCISQKASAYHRSETITTTSFNENHFHIPICILSLVCDAILSSNHVNRTTHSLYSMQLGADENQLYVALVDKWYICRKRSYSNSLHSPGRKDLR